MTIHLSHARIDLVRGDITTIPADAIVNAANSRLAGGGGVDGAIHAAGGPDILAELRERYPNGTATGTAVVTRAGRLPATWLIHAVGPVWRGGAEGEEELLRRAYDASMALASGLGVRSITFPAISAGTYGYPVEDAARVALRAVRERLVGSAGIEVATFVLWSADTYEAFRRVLDEVDAPPASG